MHAFISSVVRSVLCDCTASYSCLATSSNGARVGLSIMNHFGSVDSFDAGSVLDGWSCMLM